jgi:SsrA-binding protein
MPTLATNKTVRANYLILETLEAGIALTGPETKAAKGGHINLKGSYITISNDHKSCLLVGAHISPYKPAAAVQKSYDPARSRVLLLNAKELNYLGGKRQEAGLTILPISLYTKGGFVKVELGVARGKKEFDKRASIKKREVDREIARAIRSRR